MKIVVASQWVRALLLAVAVAASTACGSESGNAPARPAATSSLEAGFALVGATIIDGTGRAPIPDGVIVGRGTRIIAVGPRATVRIPGDVRRIDVAGRWVMPGMIDAHVHFFETGRIYTKPAQLDLTRIVSYEEEIRWMKARIPVTLARYLCAGVTSAVSVGGPRFEFDVRDGARKTTKAPNVYIAHGPITSAHMGHEVFPTIDGDEATRYVANADDAGAEVKRGKAWGGDLIKAGYLGGPFAPAEVRYFDEVLPRIVSVAHTLQMPVTIHVMELAAAKQAIAAGVDSLAHLPFDAPVDDEFLRAARERHVSVVTTVAVLQRDIDAQSGKVALTPVESRCGDPEVVASWSAVKELPPVADSAVKQTAEAVRIAIDNVKRINAFGIAIAIGVDPGNLGLLHGASVHQELALLASAGIPAMDLIVAATRNAAHVAGKDTEVGTLEPGKLADLIVLSADPLKDIRNVGAIVDVMKSGTVFSSSELLP